MNENIIIPYYIYHYEDSSNNIYYGLISYEKIENTMLYKGWKLYQIFYAFNPNLKPIPDDTKLFSLEIRDYFPYDIQEYKNIYDIYSINIEEPYTVNLITYNRRIPNVKDLYFYELNGHIFPTFEPNPPNNDKGWTLPNINPIFVMITNNNNFFCDNGRCLPSPIPDNYFKQNVNEKSNISIQECLMSCKGGVGILNLVENISKNIKNNKIYNTEIDNKSSKIYFVFGILFIIFIIVFIFIILNK